MSFYPTLEEKLEIDKKEIIRVMLAHTEAKYMVQVLKKGPPKDLGYMWGLNNTDGYWSERHRQPSCSGSPRQSHCRDAGA